MLDCALAGARTAITSHAGALDVLLHRVVRRAVRRAALFPPSARRPRARGRRGHADLRRRRRPGDEEVASAGGALGEVAQPRDVVGPPLLVVVGEVRDAVAQAPAPVGLLAQPDDGPESTRFGALAVRIWEPLLACETVGAP